MGVLEKWRAILEKWRAILASWRQISSAVLLNVGAYLAPGLGLLALANALGLVEKFKSSCN
jgi:hypothetical protein